MAGKGITLNSGGWGSEASLREPWGTSTRREGQRREASDRGRRCHRKQGKSVWIGGSAQKVPLERSNICVPGERSAVAWWGRSPTTFGSEESRTGNKKDRL